MNPTKKRSTHIGPLTYPDSKFQPGPAKKTFGSAEYVSNYGEHRGWLIIAFPQTLISSLSLSLSRSSYINQLPPLSSSQTLKTRSEPFKLLSILYLFIFDIEFVEMVFHVIWNCINTMILRAQSIAIGNTKGCEIKKIRKGTSGLADSIISVNSRHFSRFHTSSFPVNSQIIVFFVFVFVNS